MRAWMIGLACSLLFGLTGPAPAQAEDATAESASEEAATPEATASDEAPAEKATEAAESAPADEATAEEESAAEGESGGIAGYGKHVANTFLAGVNGIITWPADPVMLAIEPTDDMRGLPGGVVTGPVVGFFAGTLQGVFRLFTGTLDIALAPLSFFPMFSLEPRYKLIPGWEHEG